jgi:hypothetical protein
MLSSIIEPFKAGSSKNNIKHPVRTSKKPQRVSITKVNHIENHTKPIHKHCEQNAELLNIKENGTLICLKGLNRQVVVE